jgi:hypothetical protein
MLNVAAPLTNKPRRAESRAAEVGPVIVGGHQGLDALGVALVNFEGGQVFQVKVDLLDVHPGVNDIKLFTAVISSLWSNSVKIIEKYAASGVITAVKSL